MSKIVIIFQSVNGSFEHPQHMFWMRNNENSFPIRTLIWRPGKGLNSESHIQGDILSFEVKYSYIANPYSKDNIKIT